MNLRKQLSSYIALNNYVEAIRGSQLPAGYTELEYIETNSSKVNLNTGIPLSSTDIVETELLVTDLSSTKHMIQTSGSPGSKFFQFAQTSTLLIADIGTPLGGGRISTDQISCLNNKVKLKVNIAKKEFYINDILIGSAPESDFQDTTDAVKLFASSGEESIRIYNFKIYGKINLIPAKDSSGTIGMYDIISGTFFTNSGTGSFVAGPEVSTSSVVLTDAIRNGLTGLQLKGSEVKNQPETFLNSVVAKGKTELRLPIERYDVLEYLEATNDSQYIKTNVVPDWTTEIDAKFRTGNDKTFTVLSRWTVSPTADTFGVIVSSTSSNIVSYFGRYSDGLYQNDVSFRLNANQDVVYKLSESSVQINEHNYSITRQNSGFENTLSLWIFKGNFLSEANAVNPTGSRVYYLQIKTQDNLVFDGVPVRRKSDGMLGIYDKVSGEFLINQGTGDFIAGNIIDTISVYLPKEYTMLDYIQSSGSQYIDTGRVPNNNDIIEQKFQKIGTSTATCAWYGSMPSSTTILPRISIGSFSQASVLTLFAGINHTGALSSSDINVHTLRFQATGKKELTYTLDSVTSVIEATETIDMYEPAVELTSYLFARHGTDGVQVYDNEGTKIYYHREYLIDGTLVLNMIPVRRNSDNVLGMYDTVSRQFFTNQGTGSFIAGPEMVPTPTPSTPVDIWCNNGVLRTSINEFNANAVTNGYFYNTDLEWVANSSVYITDYMKTVKGKYTLVLNKVASLSATVNIRVNLFNANKDIQSQTVIPITPDTTELTYEVGIPDGISYVRISTNPSMIVISSFSNSKIIYTDGIVETLINYRSDNLYTSTTPVINAYVNANNGTLTAGTSGSSTQYSFVIPCKSNTTYKLDGMTALSGWGSFTNSTIGTVATIFTKGNDTLTTGPNDQYLIGMVYATGTSYDYRNTLDIRERSNIATCEDLLADGNYVDEHSILDGTITRNVDVKVFDGTETWTVISNDRGFYYGVPSNDACRVGVPLQSQQMYCTHFNFVVWPDNSIPMAVNSIGYNISSSTQLTNGNITIRPDTSVYDTVEKWKAFLADQYANGTPVIVVRIVDSTTETVSSQRLFKNPVTVIEASIDNLEVTTTETEHTVPTPDYPLDIVCNNGVLKVGPNLFNADSSNVKVGYWINNNTGEEVSNDSNFLINGYIPVKSNTSYVVYGRRKTNNVLSKWNRIAWYDSDKNYISTSPYAQNTIGLGTSPSNAAYARFSSNPTASTITQDTVDSFNWTFREGTQEYSEFIPYNGIIAEGTPETVTITGKNLIDVTKDTTGKFIGEDGSINIEPYSCYSDLIPVKEGESYTYSGICNVGSTAVANNKRIHGYVNGVWNRQIAVTTVDKNTSFYTTFTIPVGINGIRISHWKDDTYTQVEEGIRPTKYEEYYQESFASEDLLKLGDYQDVQDVINGIKSKKIGVKVLDGTENWIKTVQYTNLYEISLKNDGALSGEIMFALTSTHLIGTAETNTNMPDNSIKLTTRGIDRTNPLMFIKTSQGNDTLEGFKQYLADQYAVGTPIIVVYPLADTVEETVESRDVFITSGTNTIERNSEYVSNGDITVGYKKLR